ncbi:fibronectin type III domain-containing protein [Pleionea sp. CnH1-48]|uniref:fibronectin type III domain-containing protein n=1 Tax=Pleionea sp. CnH1-48 TaxID=2954494 RepID=UPI00209798FC|nr:fibronectin type III domain-containing protein [Pleionea sp. CnH1-48]MCO7224112.1 fibronectin type III domain-containing protein [Pleionea sp. CnH1-48]
MSRTLSVLKRSHVIKRKKTLLTLATVASLLSGHTAVAREHGGEEFDRIPIDCTQIDETCGGGGSSYVIVPSAPEYIHYSPFSEKGNLKVEWAAAYGGTQVPSYKLYRQDNKGSWSLVYSGFARNQTFSGLVDGLYRFRVQACTSKGCGDFREFVHSRVSRSKMNKYVPRVSSTGSRARTFGSTTYDVAKLGYGFDSLNGEPMNGHCWTNDADILGGGASVDEGDMKFRAANTHSELYAALDLSEDTTLNLNYGIFNAEYHYKKKLVSKIHNVGSEGLIIAKLENFHRNEYTKSEAFLNLTPTAKNYLLTGQKENFRNTCGDEYVSETTIGKLAYIAIHVTSDSKSISEVRSTTEEIKGSLQGYASGGFSETEVSEITSKYKGYSISVTASTLGSTEGITEFIQFDKFFELYNQFQASEGTAVVKYKTKKYNVPEELSSQPHFNVFLDYRPYQNFIRTWRTYDAQLQERCQYFDPNLFSELYKKFDAEARRVGYSNLGTYCAIAKGLVAENMQHCGEHQSWSECVAPVSSSCQDSVTGNSCTHYANQVPKWYEDRDSDELWVRIVNASIDKKYASATKYMCLGPKEIVDYTKQWNNCGEYCTSDVPGVGIDFLGGWNIDAKSHRIVEESSGDYAGQTCLKSYAKIHSKAWWKSGGKWHSRQTLNKLQAVDEPYIF